MAKRNLPGAPGHQGSRQATGALAEGAFVKRIGLKSANGLFSQQLCKRSRSKRPRLRFPICSSKSREGKEFTITENGEPKAKLSPSRHLPIANLAREVCPGKYGLSPDFDAPLDDFKDYMK